MDSAHQNGRRAFLSAAKSEFKHFEHFYFHNCLYEGVWKDNARRWDQQTPTMGGSCAPTGQTTSVSSSVMPLCRPMRSPTLAARTNTGTPSQVKSGWSAPAKHWSNNVWINPVPEKYWGYTHSIGMIQEIFENRMHPMTLDGIYSRHARASLMSRRQNGLLGVLRSHPVMSLAFALALALVLFFATGFGPPRHSTWSDPAHQAQPLEGWMTPRYIANSWNVDGPEPSQTSRRERSAQRSAPRCKISPISAAYHLRRS